MTTRIVDVPSDLLAAAAAAPDLEPVAVPKVRKTAKARAKAATGAKANPNPAAGLLAAVEFVSVAQSKNGLPNDTFSKLSGGWLAASNNILTVATKVEEDLQVCPHTLQLKAALKRVRDEVSIAQLSHNGISIASGDFRAIVQCIPSDQITIYPPDPPIAPIDDRIKIAFEKVIRVLNENAQEHYKAGALLQANTVVSTNGAVLIEAWHGIDLPPMLVVPKSFISAIIKTNKHLSKFGYSASSVTFWFDDDSFIKTQLFDNNYPDYHRLLHSTFSDFWHVPENFFAAVESVGTFNDQGRVFFKEGQIVSTYDEVPSYYRIDGLPDGFGVSSSFIKLIEPFTTKLYFEGASMHFIGENVRGVIAGLSAPKVRVYGDESQGRSTHGAAFEDDDIPF